MVTVFTLLAALAFDVPPGWTTAPTSSSMRVADFTLPRAAADAEDATATLYFFGGTGGSIQANLDRWIGQIAQPDGTPSSAVARSTKLASTSGLSITHVDLTGTYVAEVTPGSAERHNKPGFRLRAAVVETPDGPYFVKVVGPAATLAKWDAAISSFLRSLRVRGEGPQ